MMKMDAFASSHVPFDGDGQASDGSWLLWVHIYNDDAWVMMVSRRY
jgi:hypothetical protein